MGRSRIYPTSAGDRQKRLAGPRFHCRGLSLRPSGQCKVGDRIVGLMMADVSIAGRAAQAGAAAAIPQFQRNVLTWIFVSAAMVLALMAPALWNGFPLIFPDTGGYLDRPVFGLSLIHISEPTRL